MRILFVSTNLPVPANNGQAIRTLSILRALRSLGHRLNFVSFAPRVRPAMLDPLPSCCEDIDLLESEWKLNNMSQGSDYIGRIRSLLLFRSYSAERFRCQAMKARIDHHLLSSSFDLIICDSLYALANVPKTDVPVLLNCHNVEHVILSRYAQIERSYAKKWYARMESFLLRKAERTACRRSSYAMACSEHDRDMLVQLRPALPVFVVPNSVNTDLSFSFSSKENSSDAPVVLFQGGMDWYPNRDAVEFFAHSIFPFIRTECPHVRFVVAGRNPPANFVMKFRDDSSIEFTGTVADMTPYLSAATVIVVPLRLGSGTRIKILEACAARKAVVSTTIGAEGLQFKSGREIVLADSPRAFAESVVSLIRDSRRRERLADAARTAVVQRYSHAALVLSLAAVVGDSKPCKAAVQCTSSLQGNP
jgi:glycosyltransferase involved in cell wall biosynthesis